MLAGFLDRTSAITLAARGSLRSDGFRLSYFVHLAAQIELNQSFDWTNTTDVARVDAQGLQTATDSLQRNETT